MEHESEANAALAPRRALNGRVVLVNDNPIRLRTRINPKHCHRTIGFVFEIVDAPARLQCGGVAAHRVTSAFNNTRRRAIDDANAFVEVVDVSWQAAAWLE